MNRAGLVSLRLLPTLARTGPARYSSGGHSWEDDVRLCQEKQQLRPDLFGMAIEGQPKPKDNYSGLKMYHELESGQKPHILTRVSYVFLTGLFVGSVIYYFTGYENRFVKNPKKSIGVD